MARVFKKRNQWWIDYSYEGRRIRKQIGSKKLAELALKKKLVMIAENKHLDIKKSHKIKLKELSQKYLEVYLKPNRPTWWKSEKHNLRHLNDYFGNMYIHEINPLDIEKFRQERLKIVSKKSVNDNVACLRAMFNKAIEWDLYGGVNPVSKIKMFKIDPTRTRYLEKEEIPRFLSNCPQYLKNIVEFAINTGMRQAEIFNLKWKDINYNTGLIYVMKTKNNEIREIPMNESVKNILFRVKKDPESPYVFPSKNGKPFDNVKRSFKTALHKSGIKDFRFHDLRHTFASHLVMSGVDLLTVKELLGHKDFKMTLRYSHLSCKHKVQAVNALDRNIGTNLAPNPAIKTRSNDFSDSYDNFSSDLVPEGRSYFHFSCRKIR